MNLREQLLLTHSKVNTQTIAAWIGSDAQRFGALMACLMEHEVVPVQRASWVVSEVGCVHPHLLLPHLNALLDAMAAPLLHMEIVVVATRVLSTQLRESFAHASREADAVEH